MNEDANQTKSENPASPAITQKTTLQQIEQLSYPCSCKACSNGCHFGSGVFSDDQLPSVALHLNISEEDLKKNHLEPITKFNTTRFRPKIERQKGKPYGKCTFYDEKKGCTIHAVKPLECKLAMGCKDYGEDISVWFMLDQFVNSNDEISMKEYESYLKTGGKRLPEK